MFYIETDILFLPFYYIFPLEIVQNEWLSILSQVFWLQGKKLIFSIILAPMFLSKH